jgi:hypothetical protein
MVTAAGLQFGRPSLPAGPADAMATYSALRVPTQRLVADAAAVRGVSGPGSASVPVAMAWPMEHDAIGTAKALLAFVDEQVF